jgi:hypothetical protein
VNRKLIADFAVEQRLPAFMLRTKLRGSPSPMICVVYGVKHNEQCVRSVPGRYWAAKRRVSLQITEDINPPAMTASR